MKKYLPVAIFLMAVLSSCIKIQPGYTDITETDDSGKVIGQIDKTDWTEDKDWNQSEEFLFDQVGEPIDSNFRKSYVTVEPSYPNPCSDSFHFRVITAERCVFNYVLTDDKLKVKIPLGTAWLNPGYNKFNFSTNGLTKGKNYRLYYIFSYYQNKAWYKGHGDIAVRNN